MGEIDRNKPLPTVEQGHMFTNEDSLDMDQFFREVNFFLMTGKLLPDIPGREDPGDEPPESGLSRDIKPEDKPGGGDVVVFPAAGQAGRLALAAA